MIRALLQLYKAAKELRTVESERTTAIRQRVSAQVSESAKYSSAGSVQTHEANALITAAARAAGREGGEGRAQACEERSDCAEAGERVASPLHTAHNETDAG